MSEQDPNAGAWLEVSLTVDGELAEAVAEVLSRYAPNGVAIESTAIHSDVNEVEGRPVGPVRVAAYLPMLPGVEDTRQRIEEALWYLGRIRPLPQPEFRTVLEADWAEAWKEHYHPIAIGRRLIIVPAWLESPDPERIPVRMDPGMAFGTGTHPTTHLCLEMIEDLFQPGMRAPQTVIDVGCGSGILSIAALKLGAQRAVAVDIDPLAVRMTGENAAANGVAQQMETGQGSVEELLRGDFSLRKADLVLANILAPVIIRLLEEGLGDLIAGNGLLVLSGIIEEQEESVLQAARRQGLELVDRRQIADWMALGVRRVLA
jgi:ribosomal protein L11 methyltransferase